MFCYQATDHHIHLCDVWFYRSKVKDKINKHNAELQRTDPGTKVTGEFSTRDIFSHLMFEMNLYHFHRFSWEKIH